MSDTSTDKRTEELRRRMADAASLPPDDPQRVALLSEIARAGEWAKREWINLIAGDERARLELMDLEEPEGLRDRLRAVPDEAPVRRMRTRWMPGRRWLGVAAAAVVTIGLVTVGWVNWRGDRVGQRLHAIAALATQHAAVAEPPEAPRAEPAALQQRLDQSVHFPVRMPDLGEGFRLMGAGVTSLGGNEVVATRWRKDGKPYTLYAFCPPDFDLPTGFARRTVTPKPPWAGDAPRKITFWSEGHCAFALMPHPPPSDEPTERKAPDDPHAS